MFIFSERRGGKCGCAWSEVTLGCCTEELSVSAVTDGLCQTLLWVTESVILLMVDRHFPLQPGRQMVLLTCYLTTLSIFLFPGSENMSLGLEGVEKRKGEENSVLSPNKKSFGKICWLGENFFHLLACPPPFTSPITCEASGGGVPCCAYAHRYINLNKSCKLKQNQTTP